MNRTEKIIGFIAWLFWLQVYVGCIVAVYWFLTMEKDGVSMFVELSSTLKVLWIVILSGAFYLYTLFLLRIKTIFDMASAKISIGIIRAKMRTIEYRKKLIRELDESKDILKEMEKNADKHRPRDDASQGP